MIVINKQTITFMSGPYNLLKVNNTCQVGKAPGAGAENLSIRKLVFPSVFYEEATGSTKMI